MQVQTLPGLAPVVRAELQKHFFNGISHKLQTLYFSVAAHILYFMVISM